MTEEKIASALKKLMKTVAAKNRSLDPSFAIELENYANHRYVRDLSSDDLQAVIVTIGGIAIKNSDKKKIGGKAVRETIFELCPDPFSDCSVAAERALRTSGLHDVAERLVALKAGEGER